MKQDMPNIDLSGIETLKKIREEQDTIKQRLEKMEKMKKRVSEVVYEKVKGEYVEKLNQLSDEAEPLKTKIRGQYAVLRDLMTELEAELNQITLEKEEMEFRNELGEFEEDFYKQEMKEWEVKHVAKQAELDETEEMKARFLSVFDSEEDLEKEDLETVPVEVGQIKEEAVEEGDAGEPESDEEAIAEKGEEESTEEAEDFFEPPPKKKKKRAKAKKKPEETPDGEIAGEELTEGPSIDEPAEVESPVDASAEASDVLDDGAMDVSAEDETVGLTGPDEVTVPPAEGEGDYFDLPPVPVGEEEDTEKLSETDEITDGDISSELEELESELLDEEEEETGDEVPLPPPVGDMALQETQPGEHAPLDFPEDDGNQDVALPPLPDESDATVMMEQSEMPAITTEDDPDGTMIISNPKIVSLNNATEGQVIVLGMGTTSMGRSPDNDIHLTEDRISRKHAQIAFGPGGYAIYDLNSENGTYVNGNRVREHFLTDGDIIMIGTYKYLYRDR